MRRMLLTTTLLLLMFQFASAQNASPYWSLEGNSNANASSKLGTTNSVPLRIHTKNIERIRIDTAGRVGIGTTTPTERLQVNSASGKNPFRVQVNGNTKMLVHHAGGMSIGSDSTPPANGLFVSGNVGIGTSTPKYPLSVLSQSVSAERVINAVSTAKGGTSNIVALYGQAVNLPGYGYGVFAMGGRTGVYGTVDYSGWEGASYGVQGLATGYVGAGDRVGLHGSGSGGANAYGVYGSAKNASGTNAAGYFSGYVYAGGYFSTSDRKFKKDLAPLENVLSNLLKLKPATYRFKTNEFQGMGLAKEKQIGLIADELKQVFPELVQRVVSPAQYDKEDPSKVIDPAVEYEAVNYQGLIPVLIASIQEQQQQIIALKGELTALKNQIQDKSGSVTVSSSYLDQNTPNPASATTTIRYHIPEQSTSARLTLTNASGQVIKTVSLNNRGAGQLSLSTSSMASGTYNYTLYVDGRQTDTKRLVVTR